MTGFIEQLLKQGHSVRTIPRSKLVSLEQLKEDDYVIVFNDSPVEKEPSPPAPKPVEVTQPVEAEDPRTFTKEDISRMLSLVKDKDGNRHYCDSTLRTMSANFFTMCRVRDGGVVSADRISMERATEIMNDPDMSATSKSTYFNAFMQVYRLVHPERKEDHEQLSQMIKIVKQAKEEAIALRPPTQKEQSSQISRDELKMCMNMYEGYRRAFHDNEWNKDAITYVILALNYYMGALRMKEFLTTRWDSDEGNSIDSNTWTMTIREHKTVRSQGVRVLEVPEELHSILTDFRWRNDNSVHLLPALKDRSKPLDEKVYRKWLQEATGGASCRALRQSCVSEAKATASSAELKKLAKTMGHSVGTQQTYYGVHQNKE